jgi:hypothetical protein
VRATRWPRCGTALMVLLVWLAAAQSAGIDGTWRFLIDTQVGERRLDLALKADGERITCEIRPGSCCYSENPKGCVGTLRDSSLEIEIDRLVSDGVEAAEYKLKGKVTKDTIEGEAFWEGIPAPFKATRLRP